MLAKAIKDTRTGLSLHYVWVYQAYHDITAKYKRTALGTFWIAGQMVVTSLALSILFGALFHQDLSVALPYVMGGFLVFGLIGYIFGEGAEMFMTSGGIIRNHAYPFTFYAFHTLCKSFFTFLHNLVVYIIFLVVIGSFKVPHWSVLLALPIVLVFVFCWGMLAGMLASRFRDMRFMLPYLGQLMSMLTPIFWRIDGITGPVRTILELNPLYSLMEIVRMPLMGSAPPLHLWQMATAYTVVGVIVWAIIFSSFRRRIPFWV